MAVLSEQDRQRVWRGLMRYWSRLNESLPGMLKLDLRAAVDATDSWIDTHGGNTTADNVGFNGALPNPFRTNASVAQKTLMFCAVACMRISPQFARQILGEVD